MIFSDWNLIWACVYARLCFFLLHLKPEPWIVRVVPPAVPPLLGETSVITGVS